MKTLIIKIFSLAGFSGVVGVILSFIPIYFRSHSDFAQNRKLLFIYEIMLCPANLLPFRDLINSESQILSSNFFPVLINFLIYFFLGALITFGLQSNRVVLYLTSSFLVLYWLVCLFISYKYVKKGFCHQDDFLHIVTGFGIYFTFGVKCNKK